MRKMFRFKYEPCKGTCYVYCDSLPEELIKLDKELQKHLITLMIEAHNKLCDNTEYSFGIDRCDKSGMFVAHFRNPESTDTFLNSNFTDSVKNICSVVLSANIPSIEGSCNYGETGSEDLGKEILRACEDYIFREEKHKNCACSKKV